MSGTSSTRPSTASRLRASPTTSSPRRSSSSTSRRSTRTPSASAAPSRSCPSVATPSRTGRATSSASERAIGEPAKLENYIEVICRLYRKDAAIQGASGLVHAVAESEKEKIAISVGPLSGRVTAKQINDAVQDALASGILEVHVLGWAFEANVGEVKSQLEKRGKVKVELIMIRPDTLAEGLKVTQPEMLFSPLALPDIEVAVEEERQGDRRSRVTLKGVALFDRKRRTTEYKAADSGYVSAWYLDEDYDGDCFVDCQMFFDFKKAPNIKAALGRGGPEEFTLQARLGAVPGARLQAHRGQSRGRVRQRVHRRARTVTGDGTMAYFVDRVVICDAFRSRTSTTNSCRGQVADL